MVSHRWVHTLCLTALTALWASVLSGCGNQTISTSPSDDPAPVVVPSDEPSDTPSDDPVQVDDPDVTVDGTIDGPLDTDDPVLRREVKLSTISVEVRNETESRADVTLRFIGADEVSEVAFVRVLPRIATTVSAPNDPDSIAVSGLTEDGEALEEALLVRGIDFDADTIGRYDVRKRVVDIIPDGGGGIVDPVPTIPLALSMLEPADAITRRVGTTFTIRWTDEGSAPNAAVSFFLENVATGARTSVGPAINASTDGANDTFDVYIPALAEGSYIIVGVLSDGSESVEDQASGMVTITIDPSNIAPTLTLLSPLSAVELERTERLAVRWEDADPDDNATIRFLLEPSGDSQGEPHEFPPPYIAEDPDSLQADSTKLDMDGVLPGTYDLVAMISDGKLTGVDRVPGVVTILPEQDNDPPVMELLAPTERVEVAIGSFLSVHWADEDEDDNARVSFLLDPDIDSDVTDGNEILLASGISEDDDGDADKATLGIEDRIEVGRYRLVGLITDGVVKMYVRSRDVIEVVPKEHPVVLADLVEFSSPNTELFVRPGDPIIIELEPAEIFDTSSNLYFRMSNVAYGGGINVDVTPPAAYLTGPRIQLETDWIDEESWDDGEDWPRRFDVSVTGDVENEGVSARAKGTVWIWKDVEILDVVPINYSCNDDPIIPEPAGLDGLFVGLEIKWRGGGFGYEGEVLSPLSFWLINDPVIPGDLKDDDGHRGILTITEPWAINNTNTVRVDWVQAFGYEHEILRQQHIDVGEEEEIVPLISGDFYQLSSIIQSEKLGDVISDPFEYFISVCNLLDDEHRDGD